MEARESVGTCDVCDKQLRARWDFDQTCAHTWPEPSWVLHGHTGPETAYVVDDYPYGFKARTQIRYWVETKAKHGQRFVSQTKNPKTGRWNKPKNSTYSPVVVLTLNDNGHVSTSTLGLWSSECALQRMEELLGDQATDYHRQAIRDERIMNKAATKVTYEVTTRSHGDDRPRQTADEVAKVWGQAIGVARAELGEGS